jgi:putative ABC transport system permease protein
VRMMTRSKVYTTINLAGLVFGLTISFILLIFAINELSYNDCFKNGDRLYRVINKDDKGNSSGLSPYILKKLLPENFRSIEIAARIIKFEGTVGTPSVTSSKTCHDVPGFFCADPELADMLQMEIIRGNKRSLLNEPYKVMISERSSAKFFASGVPIGKTVKVKINGQEYPLIVSAVYKDLPWNSTFQADFIAGVGFYTEVLHQFYSDPELELSSVNDYSVQTFILLERDTRITDLEAMMPDFTRKTGLNPGSISFQKFSDAYLDSAEIQNDFIEKGSRKNLFIYLSLSFFILFLASINYSMLSTARSAMRFKEIGVRKVLGATKGNLRSQLLTESVVMAILAFPLAYLFIGLIDPVIERYFGYRLHLDSGILLYLLISAAVSVAIGIISGLTVAIYLSGLNPVTALRSNYIIYKKISLSKIFVIFQVFITLVLFIGLINVYMQIRFCLNTDQGISKQNLLMTSFVAENNTLYGLLKKEVEKCDFVTSVSGSSIKIPTTGGKTIPISPHAKETVKIDFDLLSIDFNLFNTLGAKIISGKDFLPENPFNTHSVIINKEAARILEYKSADKRFIDQNKIIGVVSNFNIHSLHRKIGPMLFKFGPESCRTLVIRYEAGRENELLDIINRSWSHIAPGIDLENHFYDQELNALYIGEQNFGRVVGTFTLLAFIITGMGLFGLAMLIAERRMKEMSIRKVLGASGRSIIYLIQKEFIVFILIAAAFAIPLAWYFLSKWLEQFYYHISMQWYIFLLSVIVVGLFVSVILFWKTMRILRESPASALKYE